MQKSLLATVAIASALLPATCFASDSHGPGYDFVEVGWSWLHAEHDGDGFAANVSASVSPPV